MTNIHRVFCGGPFAFNSRSEDFLVQAEDDYRSMLLGGATNLFQPVVGSEVWLSPNVVYEGPFFFHTDRLGADGIIQVEQEMIGHCTDAIFLLDHARCPGSIAELMEATYLHKETHLFFVTLSDNEEIESWLHTPCWYPILLSQSLNPNTHLHPCHTLDEAKNSLLKFVRGLGKDPQNRPSTESPTTYTPSPIDTSQVTLPEELHNLREAIAQNVHETWAQARIKEGWSYGSQRDDNLKLHPCLVPYDELPESEKDYDRATAMETLKLITKLGWKLKYTSDEQP